MNTEGWGMGHPGRWLMRVEELLGGSEKRKRTCLVQQTWGKTSPASCFSDLGILELSTKLSLLLDSSGVWRGHVCPRGKYSVP